MPIYHQLGSVPRKRHMVFRRPDGALYAEELIGNKGFVGPSSLLYHLHQPTHVKSTRLAARSALGARSRSAVPSSSFPHAPARVGRQHHGRSRAAAVQQRRRDAASSSPNREDDYYYRNAQGDEIVFISDGAGVLETQLGRSAVLRKAITW